MLPPALSGKAWPGDSCSAGTDSNPRDPAPHARTRGPQAERKYRTSGAEKRVKTTQRAKLNAPNADRSTCCVTIGRVGRLDAPPGWQRSASRPIAAAQNDIQKMEEKERSASAEWAEYPLVGRLAAPRPAHASPAPLRPNSPGPGPDSLHSGLQTGLAHTRRSLAGSKYITKSRFIAIKIRYHLPCPVCQSKERKQKIQRKEEQVENTGLAKQVYLSSIDNGVRCRRDL